jgi:hypothetical protein
MRVAYTGTIRRALRRIRPGRVMDPRRRQQEVATGRRPTRTQVESVTFDHNLGPGIRKVWDSVHNFSVLPVLTVNRCNRHNTHTRQNMQ